MAVTCLEVFSSIHKRVLFQKPVSSALLFESDNGIWPAYMTINVWSMLLLEIKGILWETFSIALSKTRGENEMGIQH